ncbi:hypothetical protein R0595_002448 [Pluralibacter gergoviae]|nr:hypothetical protein [Pluralibacter gergoviae]ELW9444551.1 hypothetical protein [Pluralibacter gergoviae]
MRKYTVIVSLLSALFLAGCPGPGDRLKADEEGYVTTVNNDICFSIKNGNAYHLSAILINARGAPANRAWSNFNPGLAIVNNKVCIPPSLYSFDHDGIFYIRAIFTLKNESKRVVSALEVKDKRIRSVRPNDMEMLRPYEKMLDKQ